MKHAYEETVYYFLTKAISCAQNGRVNIDADKDNGRITFRYLDYQNGEETEESVYVSYYDIEEPNK